MQEHKVFNPEFRSRVEAFLKRQHFMKLVGFRLDSVAAGRTAGWLDIGPQHKQQTGLVHGGVIATLADVVAGFAAYTLVPESNHVVTAELKISYLQRGRGQKLHAIGTVLKAGKKLSFCESEVWSIHNGDRKLIAKASATMAVIDA